MTGLFSKANNQMKGALFTGDNGEKSLIARAKETISTGADKIKTEVAATKQELSRDREGFSSITLTASEKARRDYNYVWKATDFERYYDRSYVDHHDPYHHQEYNQHREIPGTSIPVIHEDQPEILLVSLYLLIHRIY